MDKMVGILNSKEGRSKMKNTPYANGLGRIMYEMVCSKLDMAHVVSVVSMFMAKPGCAHYEALKCVLRYLN